METLRLREAERLLQLLTATSSWRRPGSHRALAPTPVLLSWDPLPTAAHSPHSPHSHPQPPQPPTAPHNHPQPPTALALLTFCLGPGSPEGHLASTLTEALCVFSCEGDSKSGAVCFQSEHPRRHWPCPWSRGKAQASAWIARNLGPNCNIRGPLIKCESIQCRAGRQLKQRNLVIGLTLQNLTKLVCVPLSERNDA